MTGNFISEIPGVVISAAVVDKVGRKLSMASTFYASCIFLCPLILDTSQGFMTGFLFGARLCITVSFTIVYIYAPEVGAPFLLAVAIHFVLACMEHGSAAGTSREARPDGVCFCSELRYILRR